MFQETPTEANPSDRYLAIARSHAILNNATNALALIHRAFTLCDEAVSSFPDMGTPFSSTLLNIEISPETISSLRQLLDGELQRHRAIVHIDNLRKQGKEDLASIAKVPLVAQLHEYPAGGVDLNNIVEFPPKMDVIPVKPIFLDVAWNYIVYPGKSQEVAQEPTKGGAAAPPPKEEAAAQPKRGWFGFGRS